ncbi:MAG: hypothetical protein WDA10_02075 [Porticoccaceae bacterium]|jgi:hypothetical protein|nr:hypothetical protein [Pseudomonadota bacterium]
MTSGEIFGHLTVAALVFMLLPVTRLGLAARGAALLAALGLAFVPVAGLSIGDYTRSYTDDVAITSLLWLLWGVALRVSGRAPTPLRQHRQLALVFAVLALALYPATLGLAAHDPYRLGFSPAPMLAAAWVLCLGLWWMRNALAVALISLATVAYLLDIKDSDNYWDYLVDPLLGLYCCVYLARDGWRRRRGQAAAAL